MARVLICALWAAACAAPKRPLDSARAILTLGEDEEGPCVEQRWIEDDGAVVWAPEGVEEAPVVVFLHGEGGAPQDQDSAQRLLARRGYAVLAPRLAEGEAPDLLALQKRLERIAAWDHERAAVVAVGARALEALLLFHLGEWWKAAALWDPTPQDAGTLASAPALLVAVPDRTALGLSENDLEELSGRMRLVVLSAMKEGIEDGRVLASSTPEEKMRASRALREATVEHFDRAMGSSPRAACQKQGR